MKICHVIANPTVGGAEKYALYLAQEARNSGNEVSFVLGKEGELSNLLKKNKFHYDLVAMSSSFNPFLMLQSVLRLRKYFREHQIDVVHTNFLREHSLSIGAKFLGARARVVRTMHRLDQFNWKMKPLLWFYRRETDAFIAVSDVAAKYMIENGIKKDRVTVIYNGAPKVNSEKHEKAIGFLGRVVPEKGILDFVKENSDLLKLEKLIIAGDGTDLGELKKLKEKKHLKIEFLGQIDDLRTFFSKISVLILPSKGESTLPLSVIEGFSSGVPLVSFSIQAINDAIAESKSAIIVQKENHKELGEKAQQLLSDNELFAEMGQAVKHLYEKKYTTSKMWQKTESLYKKLMS